MQEITRPERLEEFYKRLREAPAASSIEEARALLAATLNAVEDDMTDIPFDPNAHIGPTGGRMYPPHDDFEREVPNRPDLVMYRQKGHETFFQANGAILIRKRKGKDREVKLSKFGVDNRGVDP